MVLAFLIATLILFITNLILNIISLAYRDYEKSPSPVANIIAVFVALIMLTWNIFAIILTV